MPLEYLWQEQSALSHGKVLAISDTHTKTEESMIDRLQTWIQTLAPPPACMSHAVMDLEEHSLSSLSRSGQFQRCIYASNVLKNILVPPALGNTGESGNGPYNNFVAGTMAAQRPSE